jgi:anti-sigma factor RsiW
MRYRIACPNDETMMDFLEHRLTGKARKPVERHLAGCAHCREAAATVVGPVNAAAEIRMPAVPQQATQRAIISVRDLGGTGWPTRLARGMRRWLQRGAAQLQLPAWGPAPAVRGPAGAAGPGNIQRTRRFGDLCVAIGIEKSGAGDALVRVRCTSGSPAEALVRVALLNQSREVASSQLGEHAVVFEAIPPGRYLLHFASQACELGRYTFEIVDQA